MQAAAQGALRHRQRAEAVPAAAAGEGRRVTDSSCSRWPSAVRQGEPGCECLCKRFGRAAGPFASELSTHSFLPAAVAGGRARPETTRPTTHGPSPGQSRGPRGRPVAVLPARRRRAAGRLCAADGFRGLGEAGALGGRRHRSREYGYRQVWLSDRVGFGLGIRIRRVMLAPASWSVMLTALHFCNRFDMASRLHLAACNC